MLIHRIATLMTRLSWKQSLLLSFELHTPNEDVFYRVPLSQSMWLLSALTHVLWTIYAKKMMWYYNTIRYPMMHMKKLWSCFWKDLWDWGQKMFDCKYSRLQRNTFRNYSSYLNKAYIRILIFFTRHVQEIIVSLFAWKEKCKKLHSASICQAKTFWMCMCTFITKILKTHLWLSDISLLT